MAKNTSKFPVGAMPAKVLVGKVLMKAGADAKTLKILSSLISELEMDRKALTLATAFPSMLWTGSKELEETLEGEATEPDRPVILFSILKRAGSEADVQQMTRTWQEQTLSSGERNLLLGSVEEPAWRPLRWLRELREGRTRFSLLEKVSVGALGFQLVIGLLWVSVEGLKSAVPAKTPKDVVVLAALSPTPVKRPTPTPKVPTVTTAKPAAVKPLPTVKLQDFTYLSGGKIKIQWKPLGKGYKYRVYAAKDAQLKDAHLVSSGAIMGDDFTWTRSAAVDWLAVKAVDSAGRLGPFSETTHVGL